MNDEFNNRITAQRAVVQIVNRKGWPVEALFGLSSKAIDRWAATNRINSHSAILAIVRDISANLFFMANKSQDQISEQYQLARSTLMSLCDTLQVELQEYPVDDPE